MPDNADGAAEQLRQYHVAVAKQFIDQPLAGESFEQARDEVQRLLDAGAPAEAAAAVQRAVESMPMSGDSDASFAYQRTDSTIAQQGSLPVPTI